MGAFLKSRSSMSAAPALTLLVFVAVLELGSHSAAAETAHESVAATAHEMDRVTPFEINGDVRDLPLIYAPRPPSLRPLRTPSVAAKQPEVPAAEPGVPAIAAPLVPMPSPTQNFAGMSSTDTCTGGQCGAGWPPDPNGDVGLNHYIQAVNDSYAIFSKTGTLLASFTENQLWSAGGTNPCNGDSFGDPIVLYDQLADRFILTHFAFAVDTHGNPVSPFYQCIAASKTSDPVAGGWWLYPLRVDPGGTGPPVGALNDYPKFGIWPDCLYMAANEFQYPAGSFIGTAFASFSRADLYSGAALTWSLGFINNATDPFTMIPGNLSGRAMPPPGTPSYFVSESATAAFTFEVRTFTAGPNCGDGGTLSAPTSVSHASYTAPSGNIVSQPGTTIRLDSIDDRLMQKVQYRKVGTAESLWVVHNVRASSSSTVRPHWAQLDVTGGVIGTTPVQQQIYAPDTTLHRWMGSLAVDAQGNMALGYSTSNGTSPNFPSLAYSGRLATDPVNTLPQSEVQLVAGAGSQTNNCGGAPCHRWGDYSAMSVDPADDCTFWYTNEYYASAANGASGNWQTRIGSFAFPSCLNPSPVLSVTPASLSFGSVTINTTADLTFTVQNTGNGTLTGTATESGPPFSVITGSPFSLGLGEAQTVTVRFSPTSVAAFNGNVSFTSNAGNASRAVMGDGTAATTTAVTSSANPSVVGQAVTFTATVSVVAPGTGTPTGTVTFFDGATSLGTGMLNASSQATLSTSALAVGSHSITAQYGGDASFNGSTSSALPQTVNKAATTSTVTSSANPAGVGQAVTFTAMVTVTAPGMGTPTGTVTFFDGATSLGTGTLSSGSATLMTSALTLGPHSITAQYGGDANFSGSTSTALTQTVDNVTFTLSAAKSGTGTGMVTSSPPGISCGATCSASFTRGATVMLTATADASSMFGGWSGCDSTAGTSCTVTVSANRTVTVTFTLLPPPPPPTFTLSVSKSGGGSGTVSGSGISCGGTCSATFNGGTAVTLTATADATSSFGGWTGCDSASGASCTVTMTSDRSVTATFKPPSVLSVSKTGTGTGAVKSSPVGIDCGVTCSASFTSGTTVTLDVAAGGSSIFGGWSGCDTVSGTTCTVSVSANRSVTATFTLLSTVSVIKGGAGTGTVTSSPPGISCGTTCTAGFSSGSTITLTATPDAASTFGGWSDCDSDSDTSCTITVSGARSVTVTFDSSGTPALVASILPTSRSVQVGSPATVFATVINSGTATALGVRVALGTVIPGTLTFQTTDQTTNTLTRTVNTAVDIPAGASQSFLLGITPSATFAPTDVQLTFFGSNAAAAPAISGVNTLLLSASSAPVPDVIALVATTPNDGIVHVPGVPGTGVFAVATINVGASGAITVSADTATTPLPVTLTICQTDPTSGACLSPPAASVTTQINANATPTFGVFVIASAAVPFDPAMNRIYVRFKDSGGVTRGSTSVAVRTE